MALTVAAAPERISGDAEPIPSLADADIAAAAAAAADCRVEEVMVFGSVARGEARHGSDIDLLVLTADCTPADLRKIECTLPTAAWEATGLPVDVVVERRVAFEYLSRNVTASFEYAVAARLDAAVAGDAAAGAVRQPRRCAPRQPRCGSHRR